MNKRVINVTRVELREILCKLTGATFAHIVFFGKEYGSRQKNKKHLLDKLTFRNITIGGDYTKRVSRRTGDETFEANPMSGKSWIEGTPLAFMDKNPSVEYLVCDQELRTKVHTQYFHDGKPISKADAIAQDMFSPSYFAEKKTAGRGTVAKEDNFFRLTMGLNSIVAINMNGKKYRVVD